MSRTISKGQGLHGRTVLSRHSREGAPRDAVDAHCMPRELRSRHLGSGGAGATSVDASPRSPGLAIPGPRTGSPVCSSSPFQRNERLVGAVAALSSSQERAKSGLPLVRARRSVAGPVGLLAHEPCREDVGTTSEERAEELDLLLWRSWQFTARPNRLADRRGSGSRPSTTRLLGTSDRGDLPRA